MAMRARRPARRTIVARDPGVTKLNNGAGRIRFGQFEADFSQEKLLKRGVVVRLENRPFQVLAALLESPGNPGETRGTASRDCGRAGTYVDFDEGLNTAVSKLRAALGDLPESPVFVETVPRRGYIFVAPVEYAPTTPVLASPVQPESANSNGSPAVPALVESPSVAAPSKMHRTLIALIAAACLIAIAHDRRMVADWPSHFYERRTRICPHEFRARSHHVGSFRT